MIYGRKFALLSVKYDELKSDFDAIMAQNNQLRQDNKQLRESLEYAKNSFLKHDQESAMTSLKEPHDGILQQ